MNIDKIEFSLILTVILILSAFMPIFHILILYLNAALLYIFGDSWNAHIWINLILSIIGLTLFYRNKKQAKSIIAGILTLIFLLPFFMYSLADNYSEDTPYLSHPLISGSLTGLVIMTVEYFKPVAKKRPPMVSERKPSGE